MPVGTLSKPQRWAPVSSGLVAPEWRWAHRGLIACVLAWRGGGAPFDYGQHIFLTIGATPTWGPTPRGIALFTDSATSGEGWYWPTSGWIPTKNVTVLVHRLKTDGTNRQTSSFGVVGAANLVCGSHTPWDDGTVYWDFGAQSGANRLTYAGGTFGDDIFVFRAGDRGSAIWQNGIERASQATAIVRTATTTEDFWLGNGNATAGIADLAKYAIFLMWDWELQDYRIRQISDDPFGPFRRAALVGARAPAGAPANALRYNKTAGHYTRHGGQPQLYYDEAAGQKTMLAAGSKELVYDDTGEVKAQ